MLRSVGKTLLSRKNVSVSQRVKFARPLVFCKNSVTTAMAAVSDAEIESLRKQVADLQTTIRKKEAERASAAPYSKSFNRTMIATILESESEGIAFVGQTLRVGGWVKTGRSAGGGAFAFLEVNDGSCFANMQVMVDKEVGETVGGLKEITTTATCVLIEGTLARTPEGTKQKVRGYDVRAARKRALRVAPRAADPSPDLGVGDTALTDSSSRRSYIESAF